MRRDRHGEGVFDGFAGACDWGLRRWREAGGTGSPVSGGGLPRKYVGCDDKIRSAVREHPDATLQELREKIGISMGITTLWKSLRRLKLTLKKKYCAPPNKSGLTYGSDGNGGPPRCWGSILIDSFSSTRLEPRRT